MRSYLNINRCAYNAIAQNYQKEHSASIEWENELKKFVNFIEVGNPKVVDLGCGIGDEAIWLAKKLPKSTIYAVDISDKLLKLHESKVTNLELILGNMTEFNPPEKVHAIWARASIHHLTKEEINKLFSNISCYLEVGGIISMVNKYGKTEELEEKNKYGCIIKRYFQYFDKEFVNKLISTYGFKILEQYIIKNDHKWLVSFLTKL